jgi:pyruvate/2-oxoglutarate dehydrogenase complex dihydrolipoamide dehydrogenase (E3) component
MTMKEHARSVQPRGANVEEYDYRLFKVPMEMVFRATTRSETRGFLKALVAVDGDGTLGLTVFGVCAAEIMPSIQIAMNAGPPYATLRDAILTYPNLVEGPIPMFSCGAVAHNIVDAVSSHISVLTSEI